MPNSRNNFISTAHQPMGIRRPKTDLAGAEGEQDAFLFDALPARGGFQ
jgi:hypothetical protein